MHTPASTTGTRGTHFWVSYSKEKKLAVTGVYEGEVEVKTNDGKSTIVSPNGGKPGIVTVTQKLSITKLVLIGMAAAVIMVGIIFYLKFKSKKRKSLK